MPTESNEMLQQQLAEQLRGIALPDAVSWWPLAIGWWIVIAFSLILMSMIVRKLLSAKKRNKYRKIALADLQASHKTWQKNSNSTEYLHSSNAILKRVVRLLEQTPNESSVSKSGLQWGEVLNHYGKHALPDSALQALTIDCYQANPNVDIEALHRQIEKWLSTHQLNTHPNDANA